MKGRPWYKRYSSDFIQGVIGLGPVTIAVYTIVLDLIYDRGGGIPNDAKWIASIVGEIDARQCAATIRRLISRRKLFVVDGELRNPRADSELNEARSTTDRLVKAGKLGGRPKKNKDLAKAKQKPTEAEAEAEADTHTARASKTLPVNQAVDAWNDLATERQLVTVKTLTPPRRAKLIERLAEVETLDGWRSVLVLVGASAFLCGGGERGWKADFDWLLKPANFTKVREGGFADRSAKGTNGAHEAPAMVWVTNDDPRWAALVATAGKAVKAYQSNKQIGVGYFFRAEDVAGIPSAA